MLQIVEPYRIAGRNLTLLVLFARILPPLPERPTRNLGRAVLQ